MAFAALVAALVMVTPGAGGAATCSAGESEETVEVGVVKAVGCFASTTDGDKTIHTSKEPVDLNGFIIDPRANAAVQITESTDETEWRVQSIAATATDKDSRVSLQVGDPTAQTGQFETGFVDLDFRPPVSGPFSIGEYFLGNSFLNAVFGGFSPAQEQSEFVLENDGAGKLVYSLKLTGPFALAGKPQAVSVDFDTKVGEKVKLDGFDIELNKVDFFPPVNLEEVKLLYSGDKKLFEAEANVRLPEFGGKGFGGGFELDDGKLGAIEVNATELGIPIAGVAELQDIAGKIAGLAGKDPDIDVTAGITLGPEINLPKIGEVAALKFDGGIELNTNAQDGFFALQGSLALVRIKLASFALRIYFSGIVGFDAHVG
ncbi:MAG: hypothetical protein KDB62_07965, partial [Solirubrobacterales bacterium]|nr:hypothetical protein [Solirubrobacterales bacterium]